MTHRGFALQGDRLAVRRAIVGADRHELLRVRGGQQRTPGVDRPKSSHMGFVNRRSHRIAGGKNNHANYLSLWVGFVPRLECGMVEEIEFSGHYSILLVVLVGFTR